MPRPSRSVSSSLDWIKLLEPDDIDAARGETLLTVDSDSSKS